MEFYEVTYDCPARFECADCQGEESHHLGFFTTQEGAQKYVDECVADESYYHVKDNWTITRWCSMPDGTFTAKEAE